MPSLRILTRTAIISGVAGVALLIGLAGCSSAGGAGAAAHTTSAETNPLGDIPDNQTFVTYSPAGSPYSISVPEGWAQSTSGTAATFTDKLNSAQFQSKQASSAPTVATVNSDLVPALSARQPGFALTDVTEFTRKGGSGVLIRYEQDAPANAVTGTGHRQAVEDYLFWKNGNEVDVVLVSPVGADNVDPWKLITDSFQWK
ncbi:hypothetical protein [Microbacterium deminutum]|uniref:Lipoprotein n=1 Tax=Microbacterium deminutum TaxID=344164 RepID=A0ABP5CD59_9MICO